MSEAFAAALAALEFAPEFGCPVRRVVVTWHALERLDERAGSPMTPSEAAVLIEDALVTGRSSREPPSWVLGGSRGRRWWYAWTPDGALAFCLHEDVRALVCATVLARPAGYLSIARRAWRAER